MLTYYYVSDVFPSVVVPLVLSIASFFSALMVILAPEVAELKGKTPIIIYIVTTLIALVTVLTFRKSEDEPK
jgi:hypothetical protein